MPTESQLQKMKRFFVKYPEVFKFYMEEQCEIEVGELLKFHRYLDIKKICYRPHIWELNILEKYKDLLDWDGICGNGKFSDEAKFLEIFRDYIVWENLCWNKSFTWNADLLSTYYYRLNWEMLSINQSLKMNKEIIFQFETYWNFNAILRREDIAWDDELLNFCINKIYQCGEFWYGPYPTFEALKMFLRNHRFDKDYYYLNTNLFIQNPGPGFCAEVFGSLEPKYIDHDFYDTGFSEDCSKLIRIVDEDGLL